MKKLGILVGLVCLVGISTLGCTNKVDGKEEINISAAASLKEVMRDFKEKYESKNDGVELVINYGSSGALKQQIEQGAPCDLFISAGKNQVEELNKDGIIESGSMLDLAKNKLVLVSGNSEKDYSIDDLTTEKVKHIGMGYPKSVPAGEYAYEVLENLNIEKNVDDKLVYAKDVNEVLAWTQIGNVDVGFVYSTDVLDNDKIMVIEEINDSYHSPIIYPMAIINNGKNTEGAREFQKFLISKEGKEILKEHGYEEI